MVERIKQIMEYYKLTPIAFAEMLGINRSNLTHLFSGRNQPSLELAKKILLNFNEIKTEWLIMGVGEMFRNDEEKELTMKLQQDKKHEIPPSQSDLFSSPTLPKTEPVITTLSEQSVADKRVAGKQIFDSRRDIDVRSSETHSYTKEENVPVTQPHPSKAEVTQIVFFYSDGRFDIYKAR